MQADKTDGYYLDYSVNHAMLNPEDHEVDSFIQNLRRVASLPENLPPLSQASPTIRPRCYSFQGTLIATRNQRGDLMIKDINISHLSLLGEVHSSIERIKTSDFTSSKSVIIDMPDEDSKSYSNKSDNSQVTQVFLLDTTAAFNSTLPQERPRSINNDVTITLPQSQYQSLQCGEGYGCVINSKQNLDALQLHAKNMGKALSRNMLSVGIPTAMREYMAKNVLPFLLRNAPAGANIALAGIAIATPIALQLMGIARDLHAGTQTRASLAARLANIALITGAGSALVASGGAVAAANALVAAVFVYVPLRDAIQYFVRLGDNNKPSICLNVCSKSAAAYAVNQVLVSEGMELLARALEPLLGHTAANMVGKAIVNTTGEAVDEMTYRCINSLQQQNPSLQLNVTSRKAEELNLKTATDQLLNTIASRSALFATTFSAANAVPFSGVLNSMVIGASLGAGYLPFFYSHAQSAPDAVDQMEAGRL